MASTTAARRIPGLCLTAVLLLVPTVLFAENTIGAEYRTFFGLNPRTTVWMVAELHLLFAAFVLGVPIFAVIVFSSPARRTLISTSEPTPSLRISRTRS